MADGGLNPIIMAVKYGSHEDVTH